jgi:hypothetical protein
MDERIAELEAKVEAIIKRLDRHERMIDPALKKLGLPPMQDEQLLHINSRGQWSRGDAA